MRTVCWCTLVVALFAGGCAASKGESVMQAGFDTSRVEKVAIVEVTGRVSGETAKNQISDFFVKELMKKGYVTVERHRVQTLLKEQEFQASDVTTDEGAARAGRILNVPAVLVINIPTYKESMNMTAKMIDVEDGSILWMGTGSGTTGKTAATILGAAAGAAAGVLVAGDETDDKVIGGVIGGVLGGVAGHALSPQQAEQVQKVIKKVCKDLPYRVPVAKK